MTQAAQGIGSFVANTEALPKLLANALTSGCVVLPNRYCRCPSPAHLLSEGESALQSMVTVAPFLCIDY